jgi:hypothetical protein
VLKHLGFHDVRVRHHELGLGSGVQSPKSKVQGRTAAETSNLEPRTSNLERSQLARIEVGLTELPKLLEHGLSVRVAEALKKIGYAHVTLDLQGYRRGSLNEQRPPGRRETKCERNAEHEV